MSRRILKTSITLRRKRLEEADATFMFGVHLYDVSQHLANLREIF
jgi:hypothetical protein